MTFFAILLCGFSIFSGLLLAVTQIYQHESRLYAWILIGAIMVVQASHAWVFIHDTLLSTECYISALFCIAPSFYLFIKAQLAIDTTPYTFHDFAHFLPLFLAWVLPHHMALPLSFFMGGVYLFWLFRVVKKIRSQRESWQQEITLLILALMLGTIVFILGLVTPLLDQRLFYLLYAIGIGLVFLLVHLALLWNPSLPETVSEVGQQAYLSSTLKQVDSDEKLQLLRQLMERDKVYQEPDLKLKILAKRLNLSGHQLSELINTHHGIHFSRYIRQYRVDAAQQLLVSNPDLSVLAVGMHVGFSSQSTFYDAFRELTGTTPAKYRKIH